MQRPAGAAPPVPGGQARAARLVGALEALSLFVLVVNVVTVHLAPLAQLLGPTHGLLYLSGIALVWSNPYPARRKWLAVVPGVGTWFATRRLSG